MDPGGTVLHATAGRSDIPGSAESAPAHGACVAAGDVVVGERGEVDVGDAEVGIGVEENVVGEAEEGLGASPPVSAARAVRLHRSGPRVEKSKSIGTAWGPLSSRMRTQAPSKPHFFCLSFIATPSATRPVIGEQLRPIGSHIEVFPASGSWYLWWSKLRVKLGAMRNTASSET
ncbi:hypothetical protein BHE74_00005325 [Ensete ventricosum]|nr:hypothetical protein GW17_00006406 [Ensete ventricosum]RWW85955.1 hypothetical protein BHE74_00005325 [Ensete ventricosum]